MQCVQCWNEIKKFNTKCPTCNEIFCSQKCLDEHELETKKRKEDEQFYAEQIEFQEEYPQSNEPFGRYPWEG